ncbi:ASCH domain-containing protein [Pelosinus sp. UFO1]|uniref:ASCH domain-containing protein n=1 Tax=Pelosinus sp. UFO1 TaxID=484770 RepID=UPI0004D0C182|nr:ASCH domain-containing protein [Pelosinus sp. UFO1]AIF52032.1 ASCH domain protein [Pelosinus sp. UFO1]
MKAITILQPWASLIACGAKQIETRSWSTKYRGKIAIHAGQGWGQWQRDIAFTDTFKNVLQFPILGKYYGAVIAIANLVDCLKVVGRISLTIGDQKRVAAILENDVKVMGNEYAFGDYTPGRYAWILANIQAIDPIPARGQQRLWNWAGDTAFHGEGE